MFVVETLNLVDRLTILGPAYGRQTEALPKVIANFWLRSIRRYFPSVLI